MELYTAAPNDLLGAATAPLDLHLLGIDGTVQEPLLELSVVLWLVMVVNNQN